MIDPTAKYIAIDTETTGLVPWGDEKRWGHYPAAPFAFSFYDSKGNSEYHRLDVNPQNRAVFFDFRVMYRIQKILSSSTEKVFFNLNFDLRMLEMSGFKVSGELHDAQFLMHIVTGGSEPTYSLKPLSIKFLEIPDTDQSDLLDSVHKGRRNGRRIGWCLAEDAKADYWMGDPKLCEKYALQDARRTMLLFLAAKKEAEKDNDLVQVYKREMKLFPVVYRMIGRGIRVYSKRIKTLKKFYENYILEQRLIADKVGGKGLNFNSQKQKAEYFFKKKKYEIVKYTESGNPSTDGDVMTVLAKKDQLAKCILECNAAKYTISNALEPYNRFRVKEDKQWIIHAGFRQVGPITGRFGCGEPNLMGVADPKGVRNKAQVSLRSRECFGPRKGYILYMPDFSQMEVWIFAFLSREPYMMETLLSGKDIHGAMATKVWGHLSSFKENYSSHRALAKFLTWCKFYGGGIKAIAEQLGISEDLAGQYSSEYDDAFPGARKYIKRTSNLADRRGWVKNPYGRKYIIRRGSGYVGVNYMVQGSCADIMKIAMIRVDKMLKTFYEDCHIILTLHDELAIEIPLKLHEKRTMRDITLTMQKGHSKVFDIPVPLPVTMSVVEKRWSNSVELCRKHLNDSKICCVKKG